MAGKFFIASLFLFLTSNFSLFAQTKWTFDFNLGAPYNFPSHIKIEQSGYPDITVSNANFYTEPFALPPYWDWHISRTKKNRIIEIEAIHNKLYLSNKPSDIKRFSISHGFNLFFINYGIIKKRNVIVKCGLGAVFAHPETEIRGYKFEDGGEFLNTTYYLGGPALCLSAGKKWYLMKRLFFNTEIKSTTAYVKVPIALGHATVFTSSIQLTFGLGFDFISKE